MISTDRTAVRLNDGEISFVSDDLIKFSISKIKIHDYSIKESNRLKTRQFKIERFETGLFATKVIF